MPVRRLSFIVLLMASYAATALDAGTGKLDIMFVAEDYGAGQLGTFQDDANRLAARFLTEEPYKSRASQIIFHSVFNTTQLCAPQVGIDAPVCDFGLVTQQTYNSGIPYDKTGLIINGVSTGRALSFMTIVGNVGNSATFTHEMGGHGIGKLLDELGLGDGVIDGLVRQNCYAGTPPSPEWTALGVAVDYVLGCRFENWYRASENSLMRSGDGTFNAVSRAYISKELDYFTNLTGDQNPTANQVTIPEVAVAGKPISLIAVANDVNGNLSKIEIYASTNASNLGTKQKECQVNPPSSFGACQTTFTPAVKATHYIVTKAYDATGRFCTGETSANNTPQSCGSLDSIGVPVSYANASHWKFDESSGSTAVDLLGGNNLALFGGAAFSAGRLANALTLNGTTSYATKSSGTTLNSGANLTLSGFIKPTTLPVSGSASIVAIGNTAQVRGYGLSVTDGKLNFVKNGSLNVQSTVTVPTGVFSHVAATWSGTGNNVKFYLNGVLAQEICDLVAITPPASTDPVVVGRSLSGVSYFNGLLDELRVHDSTLSDAEIAVLAQPMSRSLVDLPDDSPLPQIRTLYVVPSDGLDQAMDTNGKILNSVQSFQTWLFNQTPGKKLKMDTSQGSLDIGFVRLTKTDAQIKGSTSDANVDTGYALALNRIESDLQSLGQLVSTKRYAIYYGGSHQLFCGNGGPVTGPELLTAATFFNATPPAIDPSCASQQIGASSTVPGYLDYVMLHELMHTLRFIAPGSPNTFPVTTVAHVFDVGTASPQRDLMYAPRTGSDPPWGTSDPLGLVFDIGRNDYYLHGQGFLDFTNSSFLDPPPPAGITGTAAITESPVSLQSTGTAGAPVTSAPKYSMPIRNAQIGTVEPTVGASPVLRLCGGSIPASADAPDGGVSYVKMNLPADWATTPLNGVISKTAGVWQALARISGGPTHFRIYDASGLNPKIQGSFTAPGGGGVITGSNPIENRLFRINTFKITAGNEGLVSPSAPNRLLFSVDIQNASLDQIQTVIGPSPRLRLITGNSPASLVASDPGTTVATMILPPVWLDPASAGFVQKTAPVWADSSADASGVMGHVKFFDATGTTPHILGDVSMSGGLGMVQFNTLNVVAGQSIDITYFLIGSGNQ